MLNAVLALSAFVAGLTGTWSPCGFSMIDTIASGSQGNRRRLALCCATFSGGALAGGSLTYVTLAAAGGLVHGALAGAGAALAAAVAGTAGLAELRGARIRPQIRRQVPEPWRRRLPLPIATLLYGVLLGLGFTTFVLTFALFALAAVAILVGKLGAGLALGVGFGAGRALPVAVLTPLAEHRFGRRAALAMAEQPLLLRALRCIDGLALGACALVLASGVAAAQSTVAANGEDPSADSGDLAWRVPGGGAYLSHAGTTGPIGADDVAIGGGLLAARSGANIAVFDRRSGAPVFRGQVAGVSALAVSASWLAYRLTTATGIDEIFAQPLPGGPPSLVSALSPPSQLGRPSLSGSQLVFDVQRTSSSKIVLVDLATSVLATLQKSRSAQLLNPSLDGSRLLWERLGYCDQELRVGSVTGGGSGRLLLRLGTLAVRDKGYEPGHTHVGSGASRCPKGSPPKTDRMLWATALAGSTAYVTLLGPAPTAPAIEVVATG